MSSDTKPTGGGNFAGPRVPRVQLTGVALAPLGTLGTLDHAASGRAHHYAKVPGDAAKWTGMFSRWFAIFLSLGFTLQRRGALGERVGAQTHGQSDVELSHILRPNTSGQLERVAAGAFPGFAPDGQCVILPCQRA